MVLRWSSNNNEGGESRLRWEYGRRSYFHPVDSPGVLWRESHNWYQKKKKKTRTTSANKDCCDIFDLPDSNNKLLSLLCLTQIHEIEWNSEKSLWNNIKSENISPAYNLSCKSSRVFLKAWYETYLRLFYSTAFNNRLSTEVPVFQMFHFSEAIHKEIYLNLYYVYIPPYSITCFDL